MNGSQPIVVVLAADSRFTKQVAVAIAGISRSARRAHRVFVLHDGYDPALMAQLSGVAGESISLNWHDARSADTARAQLPAHLPDATLFRLRISDVLPEEIERAIYIDADVAIQRPLDELWDLNLDEHGVAAVRDAVIPWAAAPLGLAWSELDLPPDLPYFNSGVLVIETARWRSQQVREHALELLAQHRFLHADQCALNTVLAGRWTRVGPEWNLQAGHLTGDRSLAWVTEPSDILGAAIDDPAIVHFTHGPLGRPWEHHCTHPYRDLWFEHLDLTPWKGWRPPAPVKPSRARLLAGEVRRVGAALWRG